MRIILGIFLLISSFVSGQIIDRANKFPTDSGPIPIYVENDAASPTNESNSVGANWDNTTSSSIAVFSSVTGGAQNGSYYIQIERIDTGVFEQGFTFTTEVGNVYQIDVYMTSTDATYGAQMFARTGNGWLAQVFTTSNNTDTWELETITATANATTCEVTFKPNNSSAIGSFTKIDNIVITDVTP